LNRKERQFPLLQQIFEEWRSGFVRRSGISDTEQEFVFERYYKGHNSNKHQNNTGLGLAIAKKILDLHDASLVLQSQLNKGSAFAFEPPFYQ
jgi:K+-sensing histidine kinase KdpD